MSYQGYVEYLCPNGHRWSADCFAYAEKCPHCGEEKVWENNIDETNGEEHGFISDENWERFLISEMEIEICPCCYHEKVVAPERYRQPTEKELREVREWFDYETETWRKCGEDI